MPDPINTLNAHAEELKKWEQPHRQFVEFPKMLYHATTGDGGRPVIATWIVHNADQERERERNGWTHSPQEAYAAYEGLQHDISVAAAEAAGQARRMGAKAQQEYHDAEVASDEHVTDVVPPARKRSHHATTPKDAA